ncbi:hypothetical protein [Sulfurimonas sp.]
MVLREIKAIVKYAMELDIRHFESFRGYKGDSVVKITADNSSTLDLIEKFAENMDGTIKRDFELTGGYPGSHNIYIGFVNEDIFQLKSDKEKS